MNKKYVTPRKTGLVSPSEVVEVNLEPEVEEYPVTIMVSREGYLKKLTDTRAARCHLAEVQRRG